MLDTLSRAADESVLEESLRILSFVFHDHVARSQVTQQPFMISCSLVRVSSIPSAHLHVRSTCTGRTCR